MMFLRGAFGYLALKNKTWVTLHNVLFCLCSHVRSEEPVMHELKHVLQVQMTNLIMASSKSNLPLCSWQDLLKEGLLSSPGPSVQDTLFEQQVVSFPPVLTDFGWSVALDLPFPSVPSLSLVLTILRTGFTSWA